MASKVLVVDDAEDIRKVVTFVLKKEGYEVLEAGDGQEALDSIKNNAPDLVLLDLHLPVLDGPEVLKQLKSDELLKSIPVVLLTASDQSIIEEKTDDLNPDGVLKKPFNADVLKEEVRKYLGA